MASDSPTGQCRSRWRSPSKCKLTSQKKTASENLPVLRMAEGLWFSVLAHDSPLCRAEKGS